jgi:hypothetical protein
MSVLGVHHYLLKETTLIDHDRFTDLSYQYQFFKKKK